MNSVELKTLSELSQYSFYIPAYHSSWTFNRISLMKISRILLKDNDF